MLKFAICTLKFCAVVTIVLSVLFAGITLFVVVRDISRDGPNSGYMTNYTTQVIAQIVAVILLGLVTALELYLSAVLIEMVSDIHKHTRTSANILLKMYRDQSEPGSPSQKSVPFPDMGF